jgi:hypothetical protein
VRRAAVTGGLVLAVGLGPVSGCADTTERYCAAVEDNQDRLGEIASSGDGDALFRARDVYRDLADRAPDDITDEWRVVIGRIDALESALTEAGVTDPGAYDPDDPPAGTSAQDRARIRQAADDLAAAGTVGAMSDLEQQSLDVCGTPLRP